MSRLNQSEVVKQPLSPQQFGTIGEGALVPGLSDTFDPSEDARDEAALTMVILGRHRASNVGSAESSAVFRRTVELYPETYWAEIARSELANLQKRKDSL